MVVLACLYVRQQACLQSNERVFMHATFIRGVSRAKKQSNTFGDAPDYDPDPGSGLRSVLHGGGLQSLTYCPVIYFIGVQLPICFKLSN